MCLLSGWRDEDGGMLAQDPSLLAAYHSAPARLRARCGRPQLRLCPVDR